MSKLREIEDLANSAGNEVGMAHAQVAATLALAEAVKQAAAMQVIAIASVAEQVERVAVTLDALHGIIETGTPITTTTLQADGGST